MWTLTQRETTVAEDRPRTVRRLQAFTRRLRARWPRLKWLLVIEWHPGGHGWHAHMVVDRWLPKAVLEDLWGWGFVDARRLKVNGSSTSPEAVRKAAAYVAKYVTKPGAEGSPEHVAGDHRYLRPLGMTWTEVEAEGDFEQLVRIAWEWWPGGIGWLWWSGDDPEWRGPRTLAMRRST